MAVDASKGCMFDAALEADEPKGEPVTYPPCDENHWLDMRLDPPMCSSCFRCAGGKYFYGVSRIS